MTTTLKKYGFWALKGIVAAAFLAAGGAKLLGAPMMVQTFEVLGVGQWFRYLTGLIEVVSAVLLFVPGKQAIGAGLLVGTMIGAAAAHLFILGPSMVPALVLGGLTAIVLFVHRDQITA